MSINQRVGAIELSKVLVSESINCLKNDLRKITTVRVWADEMGYDNPKSFSNDFRQEFGLRPQPVLLAFRARKVIYLLRKTTASNYEIAVDFQLQDEKGLYQFIKSQTGYSPTDIRNLSELKYGELLERLERKIIE